MTDLVHADMCYCSLCDRYFPGEEPRAAHVQLSTNHPKCERCNRRFANKNSLRNHWVTSRRHQYCAVCQKEFPTAGALRAHIEYSAVHRDDSDDDSDDDDVDDYASGWEEEVGRREFPEEDDAPEPPASDDEELSDSDDYWDEDDETELEEDAEAYHGFAVAPTSPLHQNNNAYTVETSNKPAHDTGHTHSDEVCCRPSNPTVAGIMFNCPLCLEPPEQSSATRCGHVFCTSCITQALLGKKSCPVCREPAVQRQLRKIYLSAA